MCLGAEPPRQQSGSGLENWGLLHEPPYRGRRRPKNLSPRSNKQNKQGLNETP